MIELTSEVQYDTTIVRKDNMDTVSELCPKQRYELCPMENSRTQVIHNYCLLNYRCIIGAKVEAMSMKYDTTQSSFLGVPLMRAMRCNYVTLKYTNGMRCRDQWGTVMPIKCNKV